MHTKKSYGSGFLRILMSTFLGLSLIAGALYAQGFATIGGKIWKGKRNPDNTPYLTPGPGDEVYGAKVMVQEEEDEVVTYATVTGNTWTATVPAPGEYVVMFSAPGYDVTSRQFEVQPGDNITQDAYLPPLYHDLYGNPDPTNELPLANLLVYAFYDNYVNGEPDDYPIDVPLNGVKFIVMSEEGDTLATGYTGSQPTIVTADGTVYTQTDGLYYFTGLPPGEVIVTSDPSEVWKYPQLPEVAALGFDQNTEFYLNYTEEGGPAWDPKLYPGDPGTEGGAFLIWHSYVQKLGQITPSNVADRFPPGTSLTNAGTIIGDLVDADKANLDPDEPFPIPGEDHPGVTLNDRVPNGLVILFTNDETMPVHPVATVEADPVTGHFEFTNVPPGRYKMMMFDIPLDYVWSQQQVTVGPNQTVSFPLNSLLVPRFFARARGYVYDVSTGLPMQGLNVHIRYKDGSIQKEEVTDASGWYNFDDLPEIEVIGYVDVQPPPNYRGALRTERFYPKGKLISLEDVNHNQVLDPGEDTNGNGRLDWVDTTDCAALSAYWGLPISDVCRDFTFNAMNRYIQWLTANYQADLYLEPIPATEGDIRGYVFYDNLERNLGWTGDGVYQEDEERTMHGVRVELYDATGTLLLADTLTGKFDKANTLAQGWHEPYTWPPDEIGGVYVGPQPGYYEFRGLAPGTYTVKVIPPYGFSASPAGSDVQVVTVSGGMATEVNFGINTEVPLAGEIEGGVFDDVNIDTRGGSLTPNDPNDLQSLLFAEKAGVDGAPVGVYDQYGYFLGSMHMGNPLCYAGAPDIPGQPGVSQCPPGEAPIQKPEAEGKFAPGVHIYVGNDPSLPGYNPNYLPLTLPYTFGQGKFKFEADWSLVPVAFAGAPVAPLNANMLNTPADVAAILPTNRPVITNPVPPGGPAATLSKGDVFTITGQNFGDSTGFSTVTLAGKKQKIKSWSDTQIKIKIRGDAMSGGLVVATSTGISNAIPIEIHYNSKRRKYVEKRGVWVDAGNTSGVEDGSEAHPYNTIAEALQHNTPKKPKIIFVAPGVYRERIQFTEDKVHLIGFGPQETIINGIPDLQPGSALNLLQGQGVEGYGPTIFIGRGGETGGVRNVSISGFTVTGGTVHEDIGAGIFGDYGNDKIVVNNCIIARNGGYYGGGIWLHKSNHNVRVWSCVIAENGSYGGYSGGISVNDEPEYGPAHGEPEHVWDDSLAGPPPGKYEIYNNLFYHNFGYDYGGALCIYENKDRIVIFGNIFMENKADDHGGAMFFEDCGPVTIRNNVIFRNFCPDDGGAISFEDVGDTLSHIRIVNNLIAENIADDHGENTARGGAIAFDDAFYAEIVNNTIVGNIVAGSNQPAGGGIDAERNGHEYNGSVPGYYVAPGYSNPKIYNNIIWDNWRLEYDQPFEAGAEEDLDYTWGINYQWTPDQYHVDNPALNAPWETHLNSESFTDMDNNIIEGGYSAGVGNMDVDPQFVDPANFNWRLQGTSPAIDQSPDATTPTHDLQGRIRTPNGGYVDLGAYEWFSNQLNIMRLPEGILGRIQVPTPGSSSLHTP